MVLVLHSATVTDITNNPARLLGHTRSDLTQNLTSHTVSQAGNLDDDLTTPSGRVNVILVGYVSLSAGAAAATRRINLIYYDGTTDHLLATGSAITAGQTGALSWGPSVLGPYVGINVEEHAQLGYHGWYIAAGHRFRVRVALGQAGDTLNVWYLYASVNTA